MLSNQPTNKPPTCEWRLQAQSVSGLCDVCYRVWGELLGLAPRCWERVNFVYDHCKASLINFSQKKNWISVNPLTLTLSGRTCLGSLRSAVCAACSNTSVPLYISLNQSGDNAALTSDKTKEVVPFYENFEYCKSYTKLLHGLQTEFAVVCEPVSCPEWVNMIRTSLMLLTNMASTFGNQQLEHPDNPLTLTLYRKF